MPVHNFPYRMSVVSDLFDIPAHPRPNQLQMLHHLPPKAFLALQCYLLGVDARASSSMSCLHGAALRAIPEIARIASLQQVEWFLCLCLAWMFPPHMAWGRSNRYILEITSLMDAVAALLVLGVREKQRCGEAASQKYVLLLSRFFRQDWQCQLLDTPHHARFCIGQILHLLVGLCLWPQGSRVDLGFTYLAGVSVQHKVYYVGFCGGDRVHAASPFGFSQRWFEHKVREIRSSVAGERRYKMWRVRASSHRNHMTPVFVGLREQAWKREQFIIRSFATPAQGRRSRTRDTFCNHCQHAWAVKLHSWQRAPVCKQKALNLNVDRMMSHAWDAQTLDAAAASLESTNAWCTLPWSALVRFGVPAQPPLKLAASHLWVAKVATRGQCVPWSAMSPAMLVTMRVLVERVCNPARRAHARQCVNNALQRKGFVTLNRKWIVLHGATPKEAARVQKMLRTWLRTVGQASTLHFALARWWRLHLHVVRGAPQTILRRVCNHRWHARRFDARSVRAPGMLRKLLRLLPLEIASLGASVSAQSAKMVMFDENLNVPLPSSAKQLTVPWSRQICQWALGSNIACELAAETMSVPTRPVVPVPLRSRLHSLCCCRNRARRQNQSTGDPLMGLMVVVLAWLRALAMPARCRVAVYVKQLRRSLQEQPVIVQQDKCPAAAVGMSRVVYDGLLYQNFFCDSAHYELVETGPEHVCHDQYLSHKALIPRWAHRRRTSWHVEALPYAYLNVKRKCFSPAGLVCTKLHAHVREIVASCNFPLNRLFKLCSRAVQCILKNNTLPSWEVWDMKTASSALAQRASSLDRPREFRSACKRCGCRKAPMSCFQGDVNQLFKDVEANHVLRHLRQHVDACQKAHPDCEGVTVLNGKKYRAFIGGQEPTARGRYFRFWEVWCVFKYYLRCNVFRVGVHLVRQRLGVPMGGSGSKACTSILLGGLEAAWVRNGARRADHGFADSPQAFQATTNGARYVDDLLVLSTVYCPRCCEAMCMLIYEKPLIIEAQRPVHVVQAQLPQEAWQTCVHRWLDLTVTVGETVHLSYRSKNEQCLHSGGPINQHVLPRFCQQDGATRERLKWWMSSRAHRIDQIVPDPDSFVLVMREAMLFGYSRQHVLRVASTLRKFEFVREALRIVTSTDCLKLHSRD